MTLPINFPTRQQSGLASVAYTPPVVVGGQTYLLDTYSGATSQLFSFSGSFSPVSAAMPDGWTATPVGFGGSNPTVERQAYATGTGADAGAHGSYVTRWTVSYLHTLARNVPIDSGVGSKQIRVRAWVKYQPVTGIPSAVGRARLTFNGTNYDDPIGIDINTGAGGDAWHLLEIVVAAGHALSGTSQPVTLTTPTFNGTNFWTEFSGVTVEYL